MMGKTSVETYSPYDDLNRFCALLAFFIFGTEMPQFLSTLVGDARLKVFLRDTF
jgi:hypothetical protein